MIVIRAIAASPKCVWSEVATSRMWIVVPSNIRLPPEPEPEPEEEEEEDEEEEEGDKEQETNQSFYGIGCAERASARLY